MQPLRSTPQVCQIEVPRPLRDIPGWLIWRYQAVPGGDKPRKVPYWCSGTVRHGAQGGTVDRDNLRTFEVAREAAMAHGFEGVGFAPLADFGLAFADFDDCVSPDGVVDPEVLALIGTTYAEYSPSGRGVRAVFRGTLGNRKSSRKAGYPFGFEVFSSSGYVTFTGRPLDHVDLIGLHDTVQPVPDAFREYCEGRFSTSAPVSDPDDFMAGYEPRLHLTVAKMEELLAPLDPDMGREEWINVGMALHHECQGDDTGFDIWNEWSANGTKYPSEEELRAQWDSFTRRMGPGRRQVTMRTVMWMAKNAGYVAGVDPADLARGAEDVAEGPQAGVTPPDFEGRFRLISSGDAARRPRASWLIKGVMPDAGLGVIFGASGSGKSFIAFDAAASIARGVEWRGRRVVKRRVLYIVAEGEGGMADRISAYARHHGIHPEDIGITLLYAAPNVMLDEDVAELCRSIKAAGGFDVIFVDTFAQVTPGANENASEDMGRALGNMRSLRLATSAMVVMIHHAGKDLSRGSRGWSGIKAACDFQWEVARHDNGERELHLEKIKDGEDGLRWGFRLERVTLGVDDDGDEITSCVIVENELPKATVEGERKSVRRRSKIASHILEVLETIDPEVQSMKLSDLVARAADMLPEPSGMRDTRRQVVTRTLRELAKEKDGPLYIDRELVIFCQ